MIELISLHIPKTGGTSFYHSLQEVYGADLSVSYKRKHLKAAVAEHGSLAPLLPPGLRVLHGHFFYTEIADIRHAQDARVICWLRDPIERLVSNYDFFKAGLTDPLRNPAVYERNKHRRNETLLEYARLPENRNVMSRYLAGITLTDLFFIGFLDRYAADLNRLGALLDWPKLAPVRLNEAAGPTLEKTTVSPRTARRLRKLNKEDHRLYVAARALKDQ